MPHLVSTRRACLAICAVLSLAATAHAAADAAPVSCATLTTRLSDDKNFYILTATASGDDSVITGYTFSFGDHQSFRFTFDPSSHNDHHAATVTHNYQNPGTYIVTAHVDIKVGGKTSSVTSDTCKTSLPILPSGSALPNTGARNILGLGILIAFLVAFVHNANLRHRSATDKPSHTRRSTSQTKAFLSKKNKTPSIS